jgi:hypothetical protein
LFSGGIALVLYPYMCSFCFSCLSVYIIFWWKSIHLNQTCLSISHFYSKNITSRQNFYFTSCQHDVN